MLSAIPWKSCRITKAERKAHRLYLYSERGIYRIEPKAAGIVMVTYTEREDFSERRKPGVICTSVWEDWEFYEDSETVTYRSTELWIVIRKESAFFTYYDGKGVLLLRERDKESRELEEFQSYELADEEGAVIEKVVTPDGTKVIVKEASRIQGEWFFHTRLHLQWQDGVVKGYRFLTGKAVMLPYIYSLAGAVWREDALMIKPLVFAFPEDTQVLDCKDQYLFGDRLMVCPVTEPMYYGVDSTELAGVPKQRKVYLPAGERWYDFWTETCYDGGQWIEAEAPLDKIPLYVRGGSIIPMYREQCIPTNVAEAAAYGEECMEYRVYKGKDAEFFLYEDAGDGYGYEQGGYTMSRIFWDEAKGELLTDKA